MKVRCGLLTLQLVVAELGPSHPLPAKRNILHATIVRIVISGKPAAVVLVWQWWTLTKPLVAEGLHLLLVGKVVWMETKMEMKLLRATH